MLISFKGMVCTEKCVCSNYDYIIHEDIVTELKQDPNTYSVYPCSDCHCKVWWDLERNQFGCQVSVYGSAVDLFYEDNMSDVVGYVRKHWSDD